MTTTNAQTVPFRVQVARLVSSRYPDGERPQSWDERREGIDVVETADGDTLKLFSDGQQSGPQTGWVILVTGGNEQSGYQWTLYGIPSDRRAEQRPS